MAGILARLTAEGTARMFGCSEETVATVGSVAKWGAVLTTLDPISLFFDSALESGAEAVVASGPTVGDGGMAAAETTSTARAYEEDIGQAAESETLAAESEPLISAEESEALIGAEESETLIVDEEAYAEECPELGPEDTQACDDACECEGEATDGSEELAEALPYMAMAVAAYLTTSMVESMNEHEEFEDLVLESRIIHNVINTTNLFDGGIGKTDTEVHVSILEDGTVVFAFRGTEATEWHTGFADVLTDLACNQETVQLYDGSSTQPAYTAPSEIKAHRGFQLGLKDVTDNQVPEHNLRMVLQDMGMEPEDVKNVVCVGHSLGGALATLCAKWCRDVAFPDATIGCVTIGSPRVGNIAFADDFNNRVVNGPNYRVVNKCDVVPGVPNLLSYPSLGSAYKHVGTPIYLLEDEQGQISASLGGPRPTLMNLGFTDHMGASYLESARGALSLELAS